MKRNGHADHERRIAKIESVHTEEIAVIVRQQTLQQAEHAATMLRVQEGLARLSESQVRLATIVERLEKKQ